VAHHLGVQLSEVTLLLCFCATEPPGAPGLQLHLLLPPPLTHLTPLLLLPPSLTSPLCSLSSQMAYAELLWVDRLGLYVRAETAGSSGPGTVRVAFPRPVLDERDARSVVTMASHVGWEAERRYTPSPVPTTPSTGAPGGAGASN
jgi:Protein of unknown function (DUF2470)